MEVAQRFGKTLAAFARRQGYLRAAGVNDADLAEIAGHRVETMLARYAHPLGQSFEPVRSAIG